MSLDNATLQTQIAADEDRWHDPATWRRSYELAAERTQKLQAAVDAGDRSLVTQKRLILAQGDLFAAARSARQDVHWTDGHVLVIP